MRALMVVVTLWCALGGAADVRASVTITPVEGGELKGLAFSVDIPIVAAPAGSETPIAARVSGTYTSDLDRLLIDGIFTAGGARGGRFSVLVPLTAERTEFQVTSVQPNGALEGRIYVIDFPEFSKFRPEQSAVKKWRFGLGTGIHRLDYRQTAFDDFSVVSVPVVFHALYEFFPSQLKWSAFVDGFINAVSLTNTSSSTVRDLRVSARVGYGFRPTGTAWRIQPQVGGVLRSMLVSPADFGFYRSIGVELSPSFSYASEKIGFIHLMPRYVFVFSGITDGEWAVRLRWTKAIRKGLVLFVACEYASFWANPTTVSGTTSGSLWSRQWLFWGGVQI